MVLHLRQVGWLDVTKQVMFMSGAPVTASMRSVTPDPVQLGQPMEATVNPTRNHPGQILLCIALFLLALTLVLTGWGPWEPWAS